jgi:hypothetical protein
VISEGRSEGEMGKGNVNIQAGVSRSEGTASVKYSETSVHLACSRTHGEASVVGVE